jgi:hypothetical protein
MRRKRNVAGFAPLIGFVRRNCDGLARVSASARANEDAEPPYLFFEGDPAGGLALANPPAAAVAEAFKSLSFFGFLASLLLRS